MRAYEAETTKALASGCSPRTYHASKEWQLKLTEFTRTFAPNTLQQIIPVLLNIY